MRDVSQRDTLRFVTQVLYTPIPLHFGDIVYERPLIQLFVCPWDTLHIHVICMRDLCYCKYIAILLVIRTWIITNMFIDGYNNRSLFSIDGMYIDG